MRERARSDPSCEVGEADASPTFSFTFHVRNRYGLRSNGNEGSLANWLSAVSSLRRPDDRSRRFVVEEGVELVDSLRRPRLPQSMKRGCFAASSAFRPTLVHHNSIFRRIEKHRFCWPFYKFPSSTQPESSQISRPLVFLSDICYVPSCRLAFHLHRVSSNIDPVHKAFQLVIVRQRPIEGHP